MRFLGFSVIDSEGLERNIGQRARVSHVDENGRETGSSEWGVLAESDSEDYNFCVEIFFNTGNYISMQVPVRHGDNLRIHTSGGKRYRFRDYVVID
jgi:hypothetical protein